MCIKNSKPLLFVFLFIATLSFASAQIAPDPNQGVRVPGGITQIGLTCQQATLSMALSALGITAPLTPAQTYSDFLAGYSGVSSRLCFNEFVRTVIAYNQSVEVNMSGAFGGNGSDGVHDNGGNQSLGIGTVRVRYHGGPRSPTPIPVGPVPPGNVLISALTYDGEFFGHNIIILSIFPDECLTLPEIKTTDGRKIKNAHICTVIYWDPFDDGVKGSFMTSDGEYLSLDGKWERSLASALIRKI